jgi:hypothetical protein
MMTSKQDYKDLFYRYVDSVGRQLPKKRRDDIQEEILSNLEDALEDRAQTENREPDEEMVVEILKEFGPPEKLAAAYFPQQYLIGPRMFPAFLMSMKILLVIVLLQILVAAVVSISSNSSGLVDIVTSLWQAMPGSIVNSTLLIIILVFAVLERVVPQAGDEAKMKAWVKAQNLLSRFISKTDGLPTSKDWNPRVLKRIKKENLIAPRKLVLDIALLFGLLALFNFFPQWIGALNHNPEWGWTFVPLLSSSFTAVYMPWLDLLWGLNIGLKAVALGQGAWSQITRWFQIGVKTLGLMILVSFLEGPPVIGLNPDYAGFHGLSQDIQSFVRESLLPGLSDIFRLIVIIILVIHGLDWLRMVLGLASQGPIIPLRVSKKR